MTEEQDVKAASVTIPSDDPYQVAQRRIDACAREIWQMKAFQERYEFLKKAGQKEAQSVIEAEATKAAQEVKP